MDAALGRRGENSGLRTIRATQSGETGHAPADGGAVYPHPADEST